MRFWIIIIAFLIPWSFTNGEPKGKSDLELIAGDFQVLARVTNAITLQIAANKKEVNSSEIIAELLRIDGIYFNEIVKVDAQKTFSELKTLRENVKELKKNYNESNWDGQTWMTVKRYQSEIKKASGIDLKELHGKVLEWGKTMESLDTSCPKDVIDTMSKLYPSDDSSVTEDILDKLNKFKSNTDSILKCVRLLVDISEETQSLYPLYSDFNSIIEINGHTSKYLPIIKENAKTLQAKFQGIMNIWKDDYYELFGQFIKGLFSHALHSYKLEPSLASYTVAFLDPKDLLEVKNDLKSPFFKKHVVRGASIKNLEQYLEPFHQVSVEIQGLVEAWKPFHRVNLQGAEPKHFERVSKYLHKAISSLNASSEFEKILDETIPLVETCSANMKNEEDTLKNAVHLIGLMEGFFKLQFKIANVLFYQSSNTSVSYEHFEACLSNETTFPKLDDPLKKPADLKFALETNYSDCTRKLGNSMSLVDTMQEALRVHAASVEGMAHLNSFNALLTHTKPDINKQDDLPKVLERTGVSSTLECLQSVRYDELVKLNDIVKKFFKFPSSKNIVSANQFLQNLTEIKTSLGKVENKIREMDSRSKRSAGKQDLITNSLNDSKLHAENIGVCALALVNLNQVRKIRETLLTAEKTLDPVMNMDLKKYRLDFFTHSRKSVEDLLKQADSLNDLSKKLRTKPLQEMSAIFEEAAKISGLPTYREALWHISLSHPPQNQKTQEMMDLFINTNLDFALYESRVKDGYFTVKALISYFDLILGHTKANTKPKTIIVEKHVHVPHALSWLAIICISVGVVLLILIIAFTIYGFTAKGKEKYRNLYFYYFGKPADFEKRWRYSCFTDKEDGKNALLDAVREVNKINTLACLKKGAYIDAYNQYGNTALHSAARLGYAELVEILIRHGADRSLLNVYNLTAEQCVPVKGKDKTEAHTKVQAIFTKYKKKKFRKQVPLRFPSTSFHIYIDDGVDEKLTDAFVEKFKAITSFELGTKTTHCVVKTDANGILETDSIETLSLIFLGIIFVKESWMKDCCENPKLIEQDFKYLVEKVRYKGKVYDTVVQWSTAMAKSEIPYLNNVVMAVVMLEYDNLFELDNMIVHHGANMCTAFPLKSNFRIGARPYLHAHLGPIFLIHNGTIDLTLYKNDPDKMYTVFTEEEFLIFMLKREINKDKRENPMSVYPDAVLANF